MRRIAAASTTGHGTNIIIGIAVGLESTAIAACCTGVSILIAYHLGDWAIPGGGLFGTSVATMGMLSSAVRAGMTALMRLSFPRRASLCSLSLSHSLSL